MKYIRVLSVSIIVSVVGIFNTIPARAVSDFYSENDIQFYDPNACDPNSSSCCNTSSAGIGDASTASVDLSSIAEKYKLQSAVAKKVGSSSAVGDYNSDKPPVTPASTMKLIIADTLIRSGMKLDKTVKITSDMVYGSGYSAGDTPTLGDAMDQMLKVSSNTAANVIIHALGGFSGMTDKAHKYGYTSTDIKSYYSPSGDIVNQSTISDQVDAMSHIFSSNDSGYKKAQSDLEYASKNDNFYNVIDDANKWAGTSQVAGNVAKINIDGTDYIIGVYSNESSTEGKSSGNIKNATADIASAIQSPSGAGGQNSQSQASACCADYSNISGGAGSVTGGQVKSFASQPVTATWNISDEAVESWFLKQAGAQTVIGRYGLNSSNIGKITSAIKAENVSPVFIYVYAATEGGGAGGFINHFLDEASGGGVGNAKRDAQYIDSQSKVMGSQPAWIDVGNPVDFVPQSVKDSGNADFKKMASGTIGRAYIASTAATTWEVYYPKGLKKQYNRVQDYGTPLSGMIQSIKKLGGDPSQGGASVSSEGCTGGVSGEGIQKALNFMTFIAENDGYGYDQSDRESGWDKYQADPNCTHQCGSFDCSSLISAALTEAGYFNNNPNFATSNEADALKSVGFKDVKSSVNVTTGTGLQPGDILLNTAHHTAMYIGDNKMAAASTGTGTPAGDQTGKEIKIQPYYNYPWDAIYRITK